MSMETYHRGFRQKSRLAMMLAALLAACALMTQCTTGNSIVAVFCSQKVMPDRILRRKIANANGFIENQLRMVFYLLFCLGR